MKTIRSWRARFHSGGFCCATSNPHRSSARQIAPWRNKGAEKSRIHPRCPVVKWQNWQKACVCGLTITLIYKMEMDHSVCPVYLIRSSKKINLCPVAVSKIMKNLILAVSAKIRFNFYVIFAYLNTSHSLNCLFVQVIRGVKRKKEELITTLLVSPNKSIFICFTISFRNRIIKTKGMHM